MRTITALFRIEAEADPQLLPRILGLFAQRDLTPDLVRAQRTPDGSSIRIELRGADEHQAEVLAAKIGVQVRVRSAQLECVLERGHTAPLLRAAA